MIIVNGVELMMVEEGVFLNAAGILVNANNEPIINNEGDVNMNSENVKVNGEVVENNKVEGVVNMSKNKYTVDMVNGAPVVIVNKSGKSYSADMAKGFAKFVEDATNNEASLLKARDMFKSIFPHRGDYAKFQANPQPMYTATQVKPVTPVAEPKKENKVTVTAKDILPLVNKTITVLREALPIVYKNQGGRFCLPSQTKTKQNNIVFKCACCGMEVSNAAVEFCMNNQPLFPTNKGVVLCKEDQERTKAGQPTMTAQERNTKRRQAYLKAQYAQRDRILAKNEANNQAVNQGY